MERLKHGRAWRGKKPSFSFPQNGPPFFLSLPPAEIAPVIAIAHLMAQTLYSPVMAQPQQGPSRKQQVIFVTCRTSVAELAAACGVRSTWLATIGPNVRGTLHCPGPCLLYTSDAADE